MKFSIRDMFLVTVIVALAVGWWVDRSRLAREAAREREKSQAFHELLDVFAPEWGEVIPKELVDSLAPDYQAPSNEPIKIGVP